MKKLFLKLELCFVFFPGNVCVDLYQEIPRNWPKKSSCMKSGVDFNIILVGDYFFGSSCAFSLGYK